MTRNLSAAVLAISLLAVFVPVTQAAGGTLYVDGKSGSDSDNGLSAASAFKTIAKAASKVPTGSAAAGWTVIVKGYTDYVYRERAIPTGWDRHGTPSSRIVFRAAGYVAGSSTAYVKPIVSGADRAPASGQRWSTTSTAGVWRTPWATAPFDYGKHKGSIKTALFQNGTTWSVGADLPLRAGQSRRGRQGRLLVRRRREPAVRLGGRLTVERGQ